MKKLGLLSMVTVLALGATACGSSDKDISVVSREEGSGTRGAFVELFEVEQKDESGEKVDYTKDDAIFTNSTSVMMTTIASDEDGIGYISLGSLNDTVKALEIDGVYPSVDNVNTGDYKIVRPFNICTNGGVLSEVADDFLNFILSENGQSVVTDKGYIAVEDLGTFTSSLAEGKVVVGGSSSVSPVMEKMSEIYMSLNPNATIEIQTTDSTTGVQSTIEGTYDIGMASRELKDSELEQGVEGLVIAQDAIAVIVNNENAINGLSSEQVKGIYVGEYGVWSEIQE